jgi:hypothetical protein
MIPLIGLLLCVYLVFKGVEIFQIGYSAGHRGPKVLGIIAIVTSLVIAAFFAFMFLMSDPSVRNLMS